MNSRDRKQLIIKMAKDHDSLNTNELIANIPASPATIRRDLVDLEKSGFIERRRGYICYKDVSESFVMFNLRKSINDEEKLKIGELAVSLISEGETVFIDASSTGLALARNLIHRKNITVITNSVQVAFVLSNTEINVFISGGLVYDYAVIGNEAEEYFASHKVDIAFIGASGIRRLEGLTSVSPLHASIRRQIVKSADRVYAILDASKFERKGADLSIKFSNLTGIITSEKLKDKELLNELNRLGVKLYYTAEVER